jgi:hypothetical protein
MHHGVLPTMDKHLALFQRWLTDRLSAIEEQAHRQIVERFAALPVGQRLGDGCRCRGPGGRDGAAAPTAESFALRRDEVRGSLADHRGHRRLGPFVDRGRWRVLCWFAGDNGGAGPLT